MIFGIPWEQILLVVVALAVLAIAVIVGRQNIKASQARAAAQKEIDKIAAARLEKALEIVESVRKDLGTDSGTTIFSRFKSQDEALETARLLAVEKAKHDLFIAEQTRVAIEQLNALVLRQQTMQAQNEKDQAQWQKYMELLQKYNTQGIVNNLNSPNTETHRHGIEMKDSTVNTGGDMGGGDKSVGGDEVGGDKKIEGVIKGVITDTK